MTVKRVHSPMASTTVEVIRLVVGLIWLAGATINTLVTLRMAEPFTWLEESPVRSYRWFFSEVVGTYPTVWTILLIVGELSLAILTLSRRGWARIGLVGGAVFSLFLFVSALSYTLMMAPFALLLTWLARHDYPESSLAWLRRQMTESEHQTRA